MYGLCFLGFLFFGRDYAAFLEAVTKAIASIGKASMDHIDLYPSNLLRIKGHRWSFPPQTGTLRIVLMRAGARLGVKMFFGDLSHEVDKR